MFCRVLVMFAVVLAAGAQAAWAGIYFEQEVWTPKSDGLPARTVEVVGHISGDKARSERRSEGSGGIFITHLEAGVLYLVVPDRKVYVEMSVPGPPPGPQARFNVTVTKTDRTKTVSGFRCTRYDLSSDGRTIRCWMTTDVELGEEVATYWQAGTRLYPPALTRELAEVPGFPIRIEVFSPGPVTTVTVTRLKEQDVPDSMFVVPSDYEPAFVVPGPPAAPRDQDAKE